jgi:hypothetical protein
MQSSVLLSLDLTAGRIALAASGEDISFLDPVAISSGDLDIIGQDGYAGESRSWVYASIRVDGGR